MSNSVLTLKNSLSKISFCDKECYNINNNKTKEILLDYIQDKHNIQVIDRQYVNINPHMMRNISNNEHIVSTFTNGNPYLLYLVRIDDTPCCIYIDRKLKSGYSYPKIHCVTYKFDNKLFDNETIFTGELIRDINRDWQFLISDALLINGENTKSKNVLARFQNINTILENHYMPDRDNDICPIYSKRLFQYHDIEYIFNDYLPKLSYVCKGLVFYTLNNQFSNYAWILPREDQLQVKTKDEMDLEYNKYITNTILHNNDIIPLKHYDVINPICIDSINNFQSRFKNIDTNATNSNATNSNATNSKAPVECATVECATVECATVECANTDVVLDEIETISKGDVILKILKTDIPDIYNLYVLSDEYNNNLDTDKIGIAFIPDLATSEMLYNYFKHHTTEVNTNVICTYHTYFKRWIPIKILSNKHTSHLKCYTSDELTNAINFINSNI
jgi:hypothetical protein